jgi:L-ascorbate metabolism protein UlaG (beta-lactamase superfamily)
MKIIYHGHSFLEIELADSSILVDPFIEGNKLCDVCLEDIVKKNIKMIFITHGHMDHI